MITILTEPSPNLVYRFYRAIRLLVKHFILKRQSLPYSGHYAVTRSLIQGLEKIHEPFNYNPTKRSAVAEHVHVLGGKTTLQYAIRLKKAGRIKRLTAGPNVATVSTDYNGLVASPAIDRYLVNSEWTKTIYLLDNANLKGRIGYFSSGVNESLWNTYKTKSLQLRVVFYNKRPEPLIYEGCKKAVLDRGGLLTEIIYGNYTLAQLQEVLKNGDIVVYFSAAESQGIALAEIWATNTPTIVWNPGFWNYNLKIYQSSSAPYLTKDTGLFFRTVDEFCALYDAGAFSPHHFQPRAWVEENMTDEVCAVNFLKEARTNEAN